VSQIVPPLIITEPEAAQVLESLDAMLSWTETTLDSMT